MTSSNDEVFRFATVRGVQRASSESLKGRVILCEDSTEDSSEDAMENSRTLTRMPTSSGTPARQEMISAARKFYESDEMLKELSSLETPIAFLDSWLLDHGDKIDPDKVRKVALSQAGVATLNDLIKNAPYKHERRRVVASLSVVSLLPGGNERLRTMLVRGMYIFGLIEELSKRDTVLKRSEDVFAFLAFATIVLPKWFPVPAEALARPPSIADLKVVKQKIVRYSVGDIAHIENVLKKESKSRIHRRKDIREEMLTIESERETSEERELQTTERFEMQQEASSVISDDSHFQVGGTITASYGPTVSATVSSGFETNHAKEESKKAATSFAREVMERSAKRIRERSRTQRVTKSINEVEETNTHGIDNKRGAGHIVGIYRYVDKVYKAQVYNYGKRLLLEFIVPEPASFVKQLLNKPINIDIDIPDVPEVTDPDTRTVRRLEPTDIKRENYLQWAAKYFVQDLAPPPAQTIWKPLAWDEKAAPDTGLTPANNRLIYKADKSVEIPAGYVAKEVSGVISASAYMSDIVICVGDSVVTLGAASAAHATVYSFKQAITNSPAESIPIGLTIENVWGYEITMLVKCDLLDEGFQKWQLETYSQIMRAYFELKSMYDQKVAAAQIQQGVAIDGRNPNENRKTERAELKKHVIAMLGQDYFSQPPLNGEAIVSAPPENYPQVNFQVARAERDFIQWFEQAFEWQNMTHVFYPYYWGKKSDWKDEALAQDPDPMFNAFLRAGAARVVVPVRPRFEKAMGLYLATGIIWNGNQVPQVGDPLFVSAIQEIQEQQDAPHDGTPEGDSWEFTLPTPLVILQADGEL